MNISRYIKMILFLSFFIFELSLFSIFAPVQAMDIEQDPVFMQIQELYVTLYSDMSHFKDLKYDYDNLLWQTKDMQLPSHEKALGAYREIIALSSQDTETILEIQKTNNGRLTSLDLVSQINRNDSLLPDTEASAAFHNAINDLSAANEEHAFIRLFFQETGFQVSLAEANAAFQSALDRFQKSAPGFEQAINEHESEYPQYIAAALILLSYNLAQNSRVIEYFEKFETLVGSIAEPDIKESVYRAAIHAYTVAGNFEKVKQLQQLLSKPVDEEAMAEARMMEETLGSMKSSMSQEAMDEVFFYEDTAALESNRQIHLTINNISQLQLEDLTAALWNLSGLLDTVLDSFAQNKASLTLTVSTLDSETLAAFLNKTEFRGFLLKASVNSDTDVSADALGLAREQFNVLAPLFEYFIMPDSLPDFSAAAAYARSIHAAYSGQTTQDTFREMVLQTFETVMERAAGHADFFQASAQPSPTSVDQFPRLAMLLTGSTGLAYADTGDFKSAFDQLVQAANWITNDDPQPFAADTTRSNFLALAVQTNNGSQGLNDALALQIDQAVQEAADNEIRLKLGVIKGNYFYKIGQYDKARSAFNEAHDLAASYANLSAPRIYATLGIGNCAIMMNRHDEAEKAFSEAADNAQSAGNLLLAAMAYSHLGRVRLFLGDYAGAVESADHAAAIADQFAMDSLKWESLYTTARALEAQDKLEQSLEVYLKAIDLLEAALTASSDSAEPGNDAEDVYRYAVALCARLDRTETALQLIERGRALSLKLEFEKSRVAFHEPEKQRAAQQIESLKNNMSGIQNQIQQQAAAPPESRSEEQIKDLKQQLQNTQRDYIKYVTDLEHTSPELASLYKIEPVELVKIRKLLPEDMAIVYYLISDKSLYIFFVRSDRLGYRQVEIEGDTLTTQIKLMRSIISKPGPEQTGDDATDKRLERFRKGSSRLYDILFKPIVPDLDGITRVAILPNGILNFVPFQALVPSDGSTDYLLQKYTIFYLDTLAAVNNPAPLQWQNDTPLFAFGNADDTLPEAEQEVDTLKQLFRNANVFLRGKATESEAKKLSGNMGIFHFATHGILDFKDISQSYIVLAPTPSEQEDGHFTIEEVWGYWWGDSVLVSLSACSTALGELTVRGKAVHPASAFLNAGAPSVLATLWNVDDAATSRLMQDFYKNLSSMEKAEALREAQIDLLSNAATANPYYWAPFTLIGDWR